MKKAILILITILLLIWPLAAQAEFVVMWDHNDPRPDGYAVYARPDGEAYDYDAPIWEGAENSQRIVDLLPPLPAILPIENFTGSFDPAASQITLDWNQPAPLKAEQLYYLVVRAFIGTRGELDFRDSADSEEVSVTQSRTNTATKWEIFYSLTPGGPYTKLDETSTGTRITAPFTAVPAETMQEVYFVVVTFGQDGTFSQNSAELPVMVDRRTDPQPPQNVDVQVVIPVQ